MKKLLEVDPVTKTTSVFEYDETENKAYVHEYTDVSGAIELNKQQQNDGTDGWVDKSKDWRKAAFIPNAVIYQWRTEYGIDVMNRDHWPAVKRLLNSNEWAFLRTATWRI